MDNVTVVSKSNEMFKILTPLRSSNVLQRIQVFVFEKTKMKLTEFLQSTDTPDSEKHAVLDELLPILRAGDWDKLPPAAAGQAAPTIAPVTPAKPKPAEKKPVVATKDEPSTPAPTPAKAEAPVNGSTFEVEEEDEAGKIRQGLQAALAGIEAMRNRPKPAPGLTEDQVRVITRKEVASIFRTIADVLEKQDAL